MVKEERTDEKVRYIVRICNTDLDGKKSVCHALTGIKGISGRSAGVIVHNAKIDHQAIMGYLSDEEIERLKKAVDEFGKNAPEWMVNRRMDILTGSNKHLMGSELVMEFREDINLLKKTRSYRGIRHERGLKVRGQRTRSTGRKGAAIGVIRKMIIAREEK